MTPANKHSELSKTAAVSCFWSRLIEGSAPTMDLAYNVQRGRRAMLECSLDHRWTRAADTDRGVF